jgi:MarR family transcriptional regulator, organic hydroperoxide resistance regulator
MTQPSHFSHYPRAGPSSASAPADERRDLINFTEAAETLRHGVSGIIGKIKITCQLTDNGIAELGDTLAAFARRARD